MPPRNADPDNSTDDRFWQRSRLGPGNTDTVDTLRQRRKFRTNGRGRMLCPVSRIAFFNRMSLCESTSAKIHPSIGLQYFSSFLINLWNVSNVFLFSVSFCRESLRPSFVIVTSIFEDATMKFTAANLRAERNFVKKSLKSLKNRS